MRQWLRLWNSLNVTRRFLEQRAENDAGKTEDGCAFPPQMPTVHMLYAKQLGHSQEHTSRKNRTLCTMPVPSSDLVNVTDHLLHAGLLSWFMKQG